MCELLFHTASTHTFHKKNRIPPRPNKESKEKLRRGGKLFFLKIFCMHHLDEGIEAYSFMLRPIMAEEEAVFRCSSKAEAACQCKKILSI